MKTWRLGGIMYLYIVFTWFAEFKQKTMQQNKLANMYNYYLTRGLDTGPLVSVTVFRPKLSLRVPRVPRNNCWSLYSTKCIRKSFVKILYKLGDEGEKI